MALSNILIVITVALLKGIQLPNALAHLISFQWSDGFECHKDTRETLTLFSRLFSSYVLVADIFAEVKRVIRRTKHKLKRLRCRRSCFQLMLWMNKQETINKLFLESVYSKTHEFTVKSNPRNTDWIRRDGSVPTSKFGWAHGNN